MNWQLLLANGGVARGGGDKFQSEVNQHNISTNLSSSAGIFHQEVVLIASFAELSSGSALTLKGAGSLAAH